MEWNEMEFDVMALISFTLQVPKYSPFVVKMSNTSLLFLPCDLSKKYPSDLKHNHQYISEMHWHGVPLYQ
jgi:hypothetical protein